jgi:hypothetical protein
MTDKVSFYVKEKSWKRFKKQVFRESGSVRALSSELNKIIDDYTLKNVEESLKKIGRTENHTSYTIEEIKQKRPSPPISAETLVREMRT